MPSLKGKKRKQKQRERRERQLRREQIEREVENNDSGLWYVVVNFYISVCTGNLVSQLQSASE